MARADAEVIGRQQDLPLLARPWACQRAVAVGVVGRDERHGRLGLRVCRRRAPFDRAGRGANLAEGVWVEKSCDAFPHVQLAGLFLPDVAARRAVRVRGDGFEVGDLLEDVSIVRRKGGYLVCGSGLGSGFAGARLGRIRGGSWGGGEGVGWVGTRREVGGELVEAR